MNAILIGLILLAVPAVYVLYRRMAAEQRRRAERLENSFRKAQSTLNHRRREAAEARKAPANVNDEAADRLAARRERQHYLHAKLVQKVGDSALAKDIAKEEAARLGTHPSSLKALDAALRRISEKRAFSSFSRLSRLSRFSKV